MVTAIKALGTPMRSTTALAERGSALHRFGLVQADLWLTVRLSGCTILILDWGGEFTMVHLQPFSPQTWNIVAQTLMNNSQYANKELTRYSLQRELSAIVKASGPALPKRYILVQSQWRTDYRGVTGIRAISVWKFYKQDYKSDGTVHNAEEIYWTDWNHWGPYTASGF